MLDLIFYTRGMSLNNSQKTGRNGIRYKVPAAKAWENRIRFAIKDQRKEIDEFLQTVTDKHVFRCKYDFFISEDEFFTKKGHVSKTSGDLSNLIKHLEDVIFREMGLNDGLVVGLNVTKNPSDEDMILFSMELLTPTRIV